MGGNSKIDPNASSKYMILNFSASVATNPESINHWKTKILFLKVELKLSVFNRPFLSVYPKETLTGTFATPPESVKLCSCPIASW